MKGTDGIELREVTAPQPSPVFRPGGASMHDVASALHLARRRHGLEKYGSLLQAGNGRDADVDRVQESLDGLVYELQRLCESRALTAALVEFRGWLLDGVNGAHSDRDALDEFDRLTDPVALAQRADAIAQELIAEAAEHPRLPRPDGSAG